jgi:hypothetical protein
MPRAVNLVSGPSRTADIEQTIQLGAHIEASGYNSEAGHVRTRGSRFRDSERKLIKSRAGSNYLLLPGVDLDDPIDPDLLRSWEPRR